MRSRLHIAHNLSLPIDFITQSQAILAKKGVGKSYTAAVQAEELLKLNQQVVIVDPTGAHWGLKSSADGKSAGFSIAIFGGEHADVALEESAGNVIATAIVEQRFSAIIDLSLLRKGAMNRFMADFLETLYHLNREAMHLFVDEADLFAPQKPFKGQERTLGATEDVVRRGRKRGIGSTLITQRSAVLNKDVLTQCEILTVMRLIHPNDIKPIQEWVGVHGDLERYKEMRESLPSLPKGTCYIWSPGWGDIFQKVAIRERETFNSSATPEAGKVLHGPKVVAQVDLAALGAQIAATVEKQKENDPKELRRQINELRKQLADRPTLSAAVTAPDPNVVAKMVTDAVAIRDTQWQIAVNDYQRNRHSALPKFLDRVSAAANDFSEITLRPPGDAVKIAPASVPMSARSSTKSATAAVTRVNGAVSDSGSGTDITRPMQRILDACAWLESVGNHQPKQTAVAFLAGYKFGSGSFNNPRSRLRVMKLIDYRGNSIVLTVDGRNRANAPAQPLTSEELQARVIHNLPAPEQKILRELIKSYPESVGEDELAERSGYKFNSGSFNNPRSRLRTLGLADYPERGKVKAADILFI